LNFETEDKLSALFDAYEKAVDQEATEMKMKVKPVGHDMHGNVQVPKSVVHV